MASSFNHLISLKDNYSYQPTQYNNDISSVTPFINLDHKITSARNDAFHTPYYI